MQSNNVLPLSEFCLCLVSLMCGIFYHYLYHYHYHDICSVLYCMEDDDDKVFKITHGIEGLDSGMFFKYRTNNRTRGHSWALAKERCKLDIRKYATMHFLSER